MAEVFIEPFLMATVPPGPLVVEASAGTGKTYTITNLVTNAIATGRVEMAGLLVVTFTRAAAAELATRIRARLSTVHSALSHDVSEPTGDELIDLLGAQPREAREISRLRLAQALTSFDDAVITTIHGFAMQALASIGLGTTADPDARVLEDTRAAAREVANDFLAAAALTSLDRPLPTLDQLAAPAEKLLAMPDLILLPRPDSEGASPDDIALAEMVEAVVDEVRRRRAARQVAGFTDLLTTFESMIASGASGAAVEWLRHRFKLVLIDEFQDTDPVQWNIFATVFGTGPESNLTLVGDPKQAIYSFRGADVGTYLTAVEEIPPSNRRALVINWRADGAVVESLNTLFETADFGADAITYQPVLPASDLVDRTIRDANGNPIAPLSIRLAIGDDLERRSSSPHNVTATAARNAIICDLVAHVVELCSQAHIPGRANESVAVQPGDIAVLVATASEAAAVADALASANVPAVLARGTSVLETDAASQWRVLLEAVGRPADGPCARRAALGWFFAVSASDLDHDADAVLLEVQDRLAGFKVVLEQRGVVAFLREVLSTTGVVERLLAQPGGERQVTDLEHLRELFETAPAQPGLAGLLLTLAVDSSDSTDPDTDPTLRRVDRATGAVTVMTVWVAKGLEFPIVLVPFMWNLRARTSAVFIDPASNARCLDVAHTPWPDKKSSDARQHANKVGQLGEFARLTYVALTRARHHTVLWWTSTVDTMASPISTLLFGDAAESSRSFGAHDALAALEPLLERLGPLARAAIIGTPEGDEPHLEVTGHHESDELGFDEAVVPFVPLARQWSFTALAGLSSTEAPLNDATAGDGGANDEQELAADETDLSREIAHDALPAGAAFGNVVHAIFERADLNGPDLEGALRVAFDEVAARDAMARSLDAAVLIPWLADAASASLGPAVGHRSLSSIPRRDQLRELRFEMILGGGRQSAALRSLGSVLAANTTGRIATWASDLAKGRGLNTLRGHLTGSIDLVLRTPTPSGDRYWICDYKTNRLARPQQVAATNEDLVEAMLAHDYPLQAVIYGVALHRYLRWRIASYDPAVHLGGALYLFIRSMSTQRNGAAPGTGVFTWEMTPTLITEASDALAAHES